MYELTIRNGLVVDGTGGPAMRVDVGIAGGRIVDVGSDLGPARRSIDADGHIVTPGFVDIHTHYDGQVCWDKQLTPSCWHGVTSVVMGNCGVGFAPVRPGDEPRLVELMESVEDIPGSALHEGISWGWESFADYLDHIDTSYALDVGTQVPHVAIRRYVMGDRCYGDATDNDIEAMARLTRDALKAGALGFSTSRFYGHVDKHGNKVPGTFAAAKEMRAIGGAFSGMSHGTIQVVSDHLNEDDELAWIEEIIRHTKRPVTVAPTGARKIWELADELAKEGLSLLPQVGARPASILMSLDGTINPMSIFPSYREVRDLPLSERRALLRSPEFRERIKKEAPRHYRNPDARRFTSNYAEMFPLDDALTYEPTEEDSIQSIGERTGRHHLDVLMDTMAEGRPLVFYFGGYRGSLQPSFDAFAREGSVFGLSDGGAHCGVLCDASVPTYMLAYAARDRKLGPTLPLELVVNRLARRTAECYGLRDRGLLAPGHLADVNIIDFEGLRLEKPEMVYDLPAGGKRLIQKARGYRATIKSGAVTFEQGEATGEFPGRLLRGGV